VFEQAIVPETAAILIEPIQGEGGLRPATAEFLRGLDEPPQGMRSMTAFTSSRTGVRDDCTAIIFLAKAISGFGPPSCSSSHWTFVADWFGPTRTPSARSITVESGGSRGVRTCNGQEHCPRNGDAAAAGFALSAPKAQHQASSLR